VAIRKNFSEIRLPRFQLEWKNLQGTEPPILSLTKRRFGNWQFIGFQTRCHRAARCRERICGTELLQNIKSSGLEGAKKILKLDRTYPTLADLIHDGRKHIPHFQQSKFCMRHRSSRQNFELSAHQSMVKHDKTVE
jgi:hypothetical protein